MFFSLGDRFIRGIVHGTSDALLDSAVNGTSLEAALKNSLRSALVDAGTGYVFTNGVKGLDSDALVNNIAHKLAAAIVGCASAGLKKQSCEAGALGAAVGEMVGDYLVKPQQQFILTDGTIISFISPQQQQEILISGQLIAGSIAALYGLDITTAIHSSEIAIINNANVYRVGNNKEKIAAIGGQGLGEGYYGRVDIFPKGDTTDFEVHVYRLSGGKLIEVGVCDSSGRFFNKHGFINAPILPGEVPNQLKGTIVENNRKVTQLVGIKGSENIKGKYNIQAPKVFAGLGIIQAVLGSYADKEFYENPNISTYEKLLKMSGVDIDDPVIRDLVGLPPRYMM